MDKVFKDFKEINIDLFENIFIPEMDSLEKSIVGTSNINYVSNRLFMWMFSKEDVKEFESIFGLLRQPKYGYVRSEFKRKLISQCNKMLKEGICPIEPMLYASKTVNRIISNDVEDHEDISDVICEVEKYDRNMVVKTLEHIITRWSWYPQLKIALLAAGKVSDDDLIQMAYNKFSDNKYLNYLKPELLKMLVYSKKASFVPQMVSILSTLERDSTSDRAIANFFRENFDKYVGREGVTELNIYYEMNYSFIKDFAKSIIQAVLKDCPLPLQDGPDKKFTYFKQLCIAYSKQKQNEKLREEILKNLFDSSYSAFSSMVYCLRYTKDKALATYLEDAVLRRKDAKIGDYKNAILTLGFLGADNHDFVMELSKRDKDLKYAMYGFFMVQGSETYCTLMADELIFCKDLSELGSIHRVLREVINVSPKLRSIIKEKLKAALLDDSKEVRKIALLNIQPYWRHIIDKDILNFLFEQIGYPDKPIKFSIEEQSIVLKIAKDVINNFGRNIYKYLDYVRRRNDFDPNIKQLATRILLNDFEPAPPQ